MGQLEALENGTNGGGSAALGFKGKTPTLRVNNDITSQTHALGSENEYKLVNTHSEYDLDGKTPKKYEKPADTSEKF